MAQQSKNSFNFASYKKDQSKFQPKPMQKANIKQMKNYQKVNHPRPYDLKEPEEPEEPKIILGYHDQANFGKYKGKSFYDIANDGDFRYLKWLLSMNKFILNPNCRPHVLTALLTEGTNAKWTKEEDVSENIKKHQWTVKLGEEQTVSPTITKMQCLDCNYFKNVEVVNTDTKICNACNKAAVDIALSGN